MAIYGRKISAGGGGGSTPEPIEKVKLANTSGYRILFLECSPNGTPYPKEAWQGYSTDSALKNGIGCFDSIGGMPGWSPGDAIERVEMDGDFYIFKILKDVTFDNGI